MAKNYNYLIISLVVAVLSILGIVLMMTTPFLAWFEASDQYARIFFDGDTKTRFGSIILYGDSSNFPGAVTILALIGIIIILIGTVYMTTLALSGKDCFISNRKAPGPITGIFFLLGGILGFIGMMVFLPYGKDIIDNAIIDYTWGFGFIFTLIVMIIFMLIGSFLLILTLLNKDKKRTSKKKKSKKQ